MSCYFETIFQVQLYRLVEFSVLGDLTNECFSLFFTVTDEWLSYHYNPTESNSFASQKTWIMTMQSLFPGITYGQPFQSWRIVVISGTVHWFDLKTSFHPLLWTSSGLKGTWKLSTYIGWGSLRCAKSVKTRSN